MWRQDFVIAKLARFLLLSLGMLRRLFWLLASSMILSASIRADDLAARLTESPASCRAILNRTAKYFLRKQPVTLGLDDEDFLKNVRARSIRLVSVQIQRLENEVIRLYLQRDEILNNPPVNKKSLKAIQKRIDETRKPEFLNAYRERMRQWKALQKELEDANFSTIRALLTSPEPSAEIRLPERRREISRFRPGWVVRTSLKGALAIPLIGGVVVPGLVQGTKSLSGLAERNQIEWAQKFLPASSAVPTFEETILYSYNDIVSPASDWTWTTYGEPTIKWGESLIRE